MANFRFAFLNLCKQTLHQNCLLRTSSCTSKVISTTSSALTPHQNILLPIITSFRFSHTFLSRISAEMLWKGVTSVSNAGRRKGRGSAAGRMRQKDLNRGQVIGYGKKKHALAWLKQSFKLHPLERGWTSNKLPGRNLGPPDPVGEEKFEGFNSRVLEFKPVMHMSGTRGRVRRFSAMVVVGNGKGLAGFGIAGSPTGASAAKLAKNRASKALRYIELDNNSIIHDFYSEFGPCRLFVHKMPEGFGLVCHRCIREICKVLGIKDLWVKVEGSTKNYQCITRAFFIGLHKQKSFSTTGR
ncbi:putative 28S ribosomal protein S5, mitochondrial [Caerostris extrusa]|uniref:Small ribosomal subunit protein uS5m n=1 Tax=Caerostris extrusa TaxID=172846 RepID=A0AAV4V8R8_CAEEX|nr:putative 28S ribosomal protein S5, mitochondrial [Caerostris extrusa]